MFDGFLRNLECWSSVSASALNSGSSLSLSVYRDKSLWASYFVIRNTESNQTCCVIPITSQIKVEVSENQCVMTFNKYNKLATAFVIRSPREYPNLIADFFNSINDKVNDEFKDANMKFLFTICITSDVLHTFKQNAYNKLHDASTFPKSAGSIQTNPKARLQWEQSILVQNSAYATKFYNMKFSVVTWNVASEKPHHMVQDEILQAFKCKGSSVDAVFIALQEIDMGVVSIIAGSTAVSGKWTQIVTDCVARTGGEYEMASQETLGGVYAAVIVRRSSPIPLMVKSIKSIRMGVYGMAANKGAVIFHCTAGAARFVLIGCHLSPHTEHWQQRNEQLRSLVKEVAGRYDYLFIVGDMNYRITLGYDETLQLIRSGDLKNLIKNDQLKQTMTKDPIISQLKEPPLTFMPTYKFDKNSDVYDTSQKRRVPSWTDRILIKRGPRRLAVGCLDAPTMDKDSVKLNWPSMPTCVAIRRGTCQFSDHRSVTMSYIFPIPAVVSENVHHIEDMIIRYYEKEEQESKPRLVTETPVISGPGTIVIKNPTSSWARWTAESGASGCTVKPSNGLLFPGQSTSIEITQSGTRACGLIHIRVDDGLPLPIEVVEEGGTSLSAQTATSPENNLFDPFAASPKPAVVNDLFGGAPTVSDGQKRTLPAFDPFGIGSGQQSTTEPVHEDDMLLMF